MEIIHNCLFYFVGHAACSQLGYKLWHRENKGKELIFMEVRVRPPPGQTLFIWSQGKIITKMHRKWRTDNG